MNSKQRNSQRKREMKVYRVMLDAMIKMVDELEKGATSISELRAELSSIQKNIQENHNE